MPNARIGHLSEEQEDMLSNAFKKCAVPKATHDKLVFDECTQSVIYTEGGADYGRGFVVFLGNVGTGAVGSTEEQMREAFALYRKHTGQPEPRDQTWIQFDPTNPPPPGDYWCEVPALKLRDGGCLCRALYWTGERWEGPGGEYEVGRYVPEMLEQLHGRGVVCDMDDGRDQWRLDAAIARIRELENLLCEMAGTAYDLGTSPADTIRLLREELGVAKARAEEADDRINELVEERDSMALRIERMSAELAKPEDQRLREVTDAMDGRAVMFDDIAARVRHELHELDTWIARAGAAERTVETQKELLLSAQRIERDLRQQLAHASTLADERLAHAHQLQADIEAEMQGRLALRKRLGAREDETMEEFLERLATMAGVVPAEVHDRGWQWRPVDKDTAFAPPFGTIQKCRVCGCLVAGGPTACARCAEAGA